MNEVTADTKIDLIGVPIGVAQILLAGLDYIPMPGVQRDPVKAFIRELMMEAERAVREAPQAVVSPEIPRKPPTPSRRAK